jgi:hypothetical protein
MSPSSSSFELGAPSAIVLERAVQRAFKFVYGLARSKRLFTAMVAHGYSLAEQNHGQRLLMRITTARGGGEGAVEPDSKAAAAAAELDALDEPLFRRCRAALRRLHPEQCAFVFADLKATKGPEAVLGFAKFLQRLEDLEGADDRTSTRKADHAALATLAARGVDEAERARLAKLVKAVFAAPGLVDDEAEEADREERRKNKVAIYEWLQDWSDTARVAFKRREDLISVGLAKRRGAAIVDVEEDEGPEGEGGEGEDGEDGQGDEGGIVTPTPRAKSGKNGKRRAKPADVGEAIDDDG